MSTQPSCATPDRPADAHTAEVARRFEDIERHELGGLLALPIDSVLKLAPRVFDGDVTLDERARLLVLLAAQLHPTALGWLACASQEADPTLRGLAACGYQRARTRWMALQQGLALCAR